MLLIIVPDWVSRGDFWYGFAIAVWPKMKLAYASPYVKIGLIVLALVLIALDQRRITGRNAKDYDPDTLKGRTLKLCQDMQRFLLEMGPKPVFDSKLPTRPTEISLWMIKLQCGFGMNFSERLRKLYWELGFNGLLPVVLAPKTEIQDDADLREVIDFLKKRADQLESQ